jgi:5-oxoprolinase (ATP-hydrolysing)
MTNSRLTDPEVLETLPGAAGGFPSGAARAGPAIIAAAMARCGECAFSKRWRRAFFPTAGSCRHSACMAARTANGSNRIERADGRVEHLPATASAAMEPGDVFVIETPGGGGYGPPDEVVVD